MHNIFVNPDTIPLGETNAIQLNKYVFDIRAIHNNVPIFIDMDFTHLLVSIVVLIVVVSGTQQGCTN